MGPWIGQIYNPALNWILASYLLGRERVFATSRRGMARWREKLFAAISNNARSATAFFGLPPNRVVELGAQVEI